MSNEFDVVIAGGGIAGLTAGVAAARLGRRTLVLTGDVLGGLLLSIEKVEGFPGYPDGVPGYDLCPLVQEQAVAAGAHFAAGELTRLEARDGSWRVATGEADYAARAVIVATGAALKPLAIPGEERLRGRGVSHCASCDAPLLRGRAVAVIGGGDSAMQEALTLANAASRVILCHRGPELTGQATYRDRVSQHPKIELRPDTVVDEIVGAETVAGVRARNAATGAATELEVSGVFVYVGLTPNTAFLRGRLNLDDTGRILTDGWMRTDLPGVCAAGIVRAGSAGRAVASAGEGTTAAIAADRYLTDGSWREGSVDRASRLEFAAGGNDG